MMCEDSHHKFTDVPTEIGGRFFSSTALKGQGQRDDFLRCTFSTGTHKIELKPLRLM